MMRLEIDFPQESFDATFEFFDEAGNRVKAPARLVIRPHFYPKDPLSRCLCLAAKSDSGGTSRAVLVANGRNGRVRLHDRTSHVTPPCDLVSDQSTPPRSTPPSKPVSSGGGTK